MVVGYRVRNQSAGFRRGQLLGEAYAQLSHDGQVVRGNFVVYNLITEVLHSADDIVAEDMVDDVSAVIVGWGSPVGVEGEGLGQAVAKQSPYALHLAFGAVVVEVAGHDERFAHTLPGLGLSADGCQCILARLDAKPYMDACEHIVLHLRYQHVAVADTDDLGGEGLFLRQHSVAAVDACSAEAAVHARCLRQQLHLVFIVGAVAVVAVNLLQCHDGGMLAHYCVGSALHIEHAVGAGTVLYVVAHHGDGVEVILVVRRRGRSGYGVGAVEMPARGIAVGLRIGGNVVGRQHEAVVEAADAIALRIEEQACAGMHEAELAGAVAVGGESVADGGVGEHHIVLHGTGVLLAKVFAVLLILECPVVADLLGRPLVTLGASVQVAPVHILAAPVDGVAALER